MKTFGWYVQKLLVYLLVGLIVYVGYSIAKGVFVHLREKDKANGEVGHTYESGMLVGSDSGNQVH
jgi:hypothetical protein